jgi:excisionase family DNA binding protein
MREELLIVDEADRRQVVTAHEKRSSDTATPPRIPSLADGDRLLKASQVQAKLGLSRAKVYRLMHDGVLPTVRIGGSVRVPSRALEEWIGRNTRPGRTAA